MLGLLAGGIASFYESKSDAKEYTDTVLKEHEREDEAVFTNINETLKTIQIQQAVSNQILMERFGPPRNLNNSGTTNSDNDG